MIKKRNWIYRVMGSISLKSLMDCICHSDQCQERKKITWDTTPVHLHIRMDGCAYCGEGVKCDCFIILNYAPNNKSYLYFVETKTSKRGLDEAKDQLQNTVKVFEKSIFLPIIECTDREYNGKKHAVTGSSSRDKDYFTAFLDNVRNKKLEMEAICYIAKPRSSLTIRALLTDKFTIHMLTGSKIMRVAYHKSKISKFFPVDKRN
jgi:hypothetical protein